MVELIGHLEATFDVDRLEGYGLDDELEKGDLVRPSVRLVPRDPKKGCADPPFRTQHSPDSESGLVVGTLTPFPVAGVTLAMKLRTVKPPV